MKILLVTTNFWPEPTGIAVYTTDVAESLISARHEVIALTSLPHYPWWKIPTEFSHLREGKSFRHGVSVIRAKHLIPPRMSVLMRMRFETSLWRNLRRVSNSLIGSDFDLVIACIPTVAAGLVGKRISKKLKVPFGLIVQDLSGVGAKQSGLRGGALVSRIAHLVENSVLKAADSIVVVSPAMRDVVLGVGIPALAVSQITNYSARKIEVSDRMLARERFGWAEDEFIVIHTGNMGAKQDLENVVEASKTFGADSKIRIYLVGHGNQEANLKKLCEGQNNITVLAAVPDDQYSALLSAADLLLVNERSTQMEMSLPSKLTSYLYSERPVIAAVPRGGATWKFLDGIAELVGSGNPDALAKKILQLKDDPDRRAELAEKGSRFAAENLSPEIGRARYLEWVEQLLASK